MQVNNKNTSVATVCQIKTFLSECRGFYKPPIIFVTSRKWTDQLCLDLD